MEEHFDVKNILYCSSQVKDLKKQNKSFQNFAVLQYFHNFIFN